MGELLAGRYALEGSIGEGSLARAYRAVDRLTGDPVVLKILRREQPAELLLQEFAALKAIRHPRLVRARDVGWATEDGARRPFYVADLAPGEPLDAWWPGAEPAARKRALIDLCRAMGALHRAGRRHGDIKPDNVRVDDRGRATLLDLSCVAPLSEPATTLSGTPGFLAPELLEGRAVDARADLFALGVTWRRLGPDPEHASLADRLSAAATSERPSGVAEVLEALGASPELDAVPADGAPLVGRRDALARFDAFVADLRMDRAGPRAFALVGPPGSGRSRLLEELRWRAQLRVDTVEGRPDLGVSELLSRAAGRAVAPGLEPQAAAMDALRARPNVTLLFFDDAGASAARLARLAGRDGRVGVALASEAAPATAVNVALTPLEPAAVAQWARSVGAPDVNATELARASEGRPAEIAARLAKAARGESWRGPARWVPRGAPSALRRAVAACAWLGPSSLETLAQVDVTEADVWRARAEGWLRQGEGWVATAEVEHGADLEPLAAALGPKLPAPRRAALLVAADRPNDARAMARAWRDDPRAWLEVLARLDDHATHARAAIAAGDLKRAERALARADDSSEAALARAELALKRARPDAALEALEVVEGSEASDLSARAKLARADYAGARALAERALADAGETTPRVARRLEETAALAAGYLGEPRADDRLRAVSEGHAAASDPAGQLRVTSYRGILAHLRGDWLTAAQRYERALEIARAHALDDALATGWLNLGTARQEDGDWGGALEAYERGARYAQLLGQAGTEASLRYNLANLAAEVGQLERAATLAEATRQQAETLGFAHLEVPLRRLEAELAMGRGDLERAARAIEGALELAEASGASRDARELTLIRAEIALRRGDLEPSEAMASNDDETDLAIRADLLLARAALGRGRGAEAIRRAERGLKSASRQGRRVLVARAHAVLWRAYAETPELAEEHLAAARRAWRRLEASLPAGLREPFRAHPVRAAVLAEPTPRPRSATADSTAQLRRFLAINRRLASLDTADVLEAAMDAAIELARAERGFVLLERDGELEVAAARNLDRETLASSHLKFSRSIAERVVATDEPVITVDARADERFLTERSVHAMRLKSVACVPIRSGGSARGALYLDNRFERGRFAEDDVELLEAFADQVALALTNAELHEALAARTRALAEARAALEARVEGQAAQIDALRGEVRDKQRALELRYDYGRIVGRGPRMRAVLETLERVIGSDLSVLIRGESGTGKELVAKAIHFNGARKDRPMVSLNCAALPANLIESELFGHARGAFTGADRDKRGLFVEAEGGTVFLDEVGEMPLAMQAKLLRALQEREVRPLGASAPVPFDVRVLAATNRDLRAETRAGRFREDLYYRIGVVTVELPPLRERPEDLLPLCDHFLSELGGKRLGPDARLALRAHAWPGNVRELSNVLARAHAMAPTDQIGAADLGLEARAAPLPASRDDFLEDEGDRIRRALAQHRWNVSRVSRELGIPRQTLYRRIRRLGLRRPR